MFTWTGGAWAISIVPTRLVISIDGIELASSFAGLTFNHQRYFLDARIEYYDTFDSDEPQGICIEPLLAGASNESSSDAFGPMNDRTRLDALYQSANEALYDARKQLSTTPPTLRCPHLPDGCVDLKRARRANNGRVTRAATLQPLTLGGVLYPAGSSLTMNGAHYIDPRRDDHLWALEVSSPISVHGVELGVGARVAIDENGLIDSVKGAFDGVRTIDGFEVEGSETHPRWRHDHARPTR